MTISKDYKLLNRDLHAKPGYGSSGHYWTGHVVEIARALACTSVLDYGCGKATLGDYVKPFGLSYTPFDPATYPKRPKAPSDLTVALDVMEHIEPDQLGAVMDDLYTLTARALFLVVNTRASSKTLSDGRNAHLIVRDYEWWKRRLVIPGKWRPIRTRQHPETFEMVLARTPPLSGGRVSPKSLLEPNK